MFAHIRASLWLLILSVLICCVLYPLVLLAIGQAFFAETAQGSLIIGKDGKPIGSRLIAQRFTSDEYFQPRPSAASYNGAASGASNWGANNYLLRNRVARQLGPIVKYGKGAETFAKKPGDGIQSDLEAWFRKDRFGNQPGIVAQWAGLHPGLAEAWINDTAAAVKDQWPDRDASEAFVLQWQTDLPESFQQWKKQAEAAPTTANLAWPFFETFARAYPGEWPTLEGTGKTKKLTRTREGSEIQSVFFDLWRQDHADVPLEPVPADMVMASGSGLDPHITLANAEYQLDRVAAAWATKTQRDPAEVRLRIEDLLRRHTFAPLGGLAGVDLVNVLEVNLALRDAFAGRGSLKI